MLVLFELLQHLRSWLMLPGTFLLLTLLTVNVAHGTACFQVRACGLRIRLLVISRPFRKKEPRVDHTKDRDCRDAYAKPQPAGSKLF